MNSAEKERYLTEYELLKKKGKPFFPYAILKDSAMALIVVGVIIVMSLLLGAEQGPKADPTTTTYVPRPEWYFFFLFELLRVIKPPALRPPGNGRHPDDRHGPAPPAAVLRPRARSAAERRPIATIAGVATIIAMAYLTFLGATAGSPTEIDMKTSPQLTPGKEVAAQSGCLACHKLGENGNDGPGRD